MELREYFNSWITVNCLELSTEDNIDKNYAEMMKWCSENFGVRGSKWFLRFREGQAQFNFKYEEHAMMFLLKYDGFVIDNEE